MLSDRDAAATIAVKSMEKASKFYEEVLGLKRVSGGPGAIVYKSGNTSVLVYRSQYAGTNKATAVTWVVGDALEGVVRSLKGKGVAFEHYDLPETTREGDIHVAGNLKLAWFKDPDGNIINLASQ